MQIFAFAFGVKQILAFLDSIFRYQHVGIPNEKLNTPNATAQRKCFRFAVEYRLKSL